MSWCKSTKGQPDSGWLKKKTLNIKLILCLCVKTLKITENTIPDVLTLV